MYTVNIYNKISEGEKKLSKHFKVREFACKDNSKFVLVHPKLIEVLEEIREYIDSAVNINSGYRTAQYNSRIGGAANSQHCYGAAADISFKGTSYQTVYDFVNNLYPNTLGLGLYKNFLHVDVREIKSRWKE